MRVQRRRRRRQRGAGELRAGTLRACCRPRCVTPTPRPCPAALPIVPELVFTSLPSDSTALKWVYALRLLRLARVFRLLKVGCACLVVAVPRVPRCVCPRQIWRLVAAAAAMPRDAASDPVARPPLAAPIYLRP